MATTNVKFEGLNDTLVEESFMTVTEAAAGKLSTLLTEKNLPDYGLRVFVAGGGCSGLQYGMAFEPEAREFDTVVSAHGVKLYIDPTSAQYLAGSTVDYIDNLMGGGFHIENPNAVTTCGCGHSFRTKESGEASSPGCVH
jgi:iron-sulfur cluster assembly protein